MKNVFRALIYLKHYWPTALGGLLSLLLVNLGNLVSPQLLRILIDQGIQGLDLTIIWWATAGITLIALLRGVFNFLQGYWSEVTSQGVAYDLRNTIFEKLQNLSFSYHDRSQTGKLMTRMTSDVEMVRNFVGQGLLQMLSAAVLLVGTVVVLIWMDWRLGLLTFLMIPAISIVLVLFIKKVMPLSMNVQKKLGNLNTVLQENLAGMRIVKAFARENHEIKRFTHANEELLVENMNLLKVFTSHFPVIFFIANLGTVAVVWVGGLLVMADTLTVGELVAFTGYLGFLLMPMFMMGMIGSMMSRAEASAFRIFEVVDAESEVKEKNGAIVLPPVQGLVNFENVSFRYIGSDLDVLANINFQAKPGQTIAILGKTGAGKSTIINLIPRFYDVTEGRVTIDGIDVRDVTLDSLRSQIGIVLQETTLFHGSIRDNIAYGRPEADLEEIVEAAKAAQAHDFIVQLPDGYDTPVGERGVGLSGGQKQRIAIARALLVDPRILILDDSTSAVDSETEFKIQVALDRLMENRTSFVIAQRISTIRRADLILLLGDQKLIGLGTHAELLRSSELYAEILETQFGDRTELETVIQEELAQ